MPESRTMCKAIGGNRPKGVLASETAAARLRAADKNTEFRGYISLLVEMYVLQ